MPNQREIDEAIREIREALLLSDYEAAEHLEQALEYLGANDDQD